MSNGIAGSTGWAESVVYLGRDIPGGGQVAEEQFNKFLAQEVTKDFPKGLTVLDAYGQMQKDDGTIEKQLTWVILLVHGDDSANRDAVGVVVDAYRRQFGDPQVMVTTGSIDVQFFQSGPAPK